MISNDDLRVVQIFEDLSDDELKWLIEHMDEVEVQKGEPYIHQGQKAEWMFVVLQGRIEFRAENGAVFTVHAGEVSGLLPHSRMTEFTLSSFSVEFARIGQLRKEHFPGMLQAIPVLEQRLTRVMLDRTRSSANIRIQQEKLAALGTMAAGLAHELNNPASAARRAAENLVATLKQFDNHASTMLSQVMFKDLDGKRDPFQPITDIAMAETAEMDPLEQSEREDELSDWLEEFEIEEPWDVAATLVASGFDQAFLAEFIQQLHPEYVVPFLQWLPKDLEMQLLSQELVISTERISDLVSAMKSYSYMDQANAKSPTDLHKGIVDTIRVIAHKFRKKDVQIVKAFGEIPTIEAFGGELNQVWTNLLDNAIDAVPDEGGKIEIQTAFEPAAQCVIVDITDNGSGIPEDLQSRIFEPFFTTKETGQGTGLGLDITYRIVTTRHGGSIEVDSKPGHTNFKVRIPTA